jgi:hypothetical protein
MHLLIARDAVDTHLSVAGGLIDTHADLSAKAKAAVRAAGFYARWLPPLAVGKGQVPTSYGEFGSLAPHLRFVERRSRELARSMFYGMSRWRGKMERKQGFLGRIVDIGAELFAMTAACVRAEMLRSDDPEMGEGAYELADAFCRQSRLRVDELSDRLWRNTDELDRGVAKRVMQGRYAWLEEGVIDASVQGPWIADTTPGPSATENVHRSVG